MEGRWSLHFFVKLNSRGMKKLYYIIKLLKY